MMITFNAFDENGKVILSDVIYCSDDEDPIEKVKSYVKETTQNMHMIVSGVIDKNGSLSLFTIGIDD